MARQQITTAFRNAFIKSVWATAAKRPDAVKKKLVGNILDSLEAKHGQISRDDVTINVTTPTYRKLQREGIMA